MHASDRWAAIATSPPSADKAVSKTTGTLIFAPTSRSAIKAHRTDAIRWENMFTNRDSNAAMRAL